MQSSEQHIKPRALLIWFIATMFYSYEFYVRVTPAVMLPDLKLAFDISATNIGFLSALYFYAYAIMQIPVGILFDRYGIRYLLIASSVLVATCCFVFGITNQLWVAKLARIGMGVGSAFAFVGCIKLARNWFDQRYLSIIIGLTNTFGIIGALGSTAPLAFLLETWPWRDTMHITGYIGLCLTVLLVLFIRDLPHEAPDEKSHANDGSELLSGLKQILSSRLTWLTALYGCFMVAPISAFAELWAVQYLVDSHQFSRVMAANLSSFVYIGIGFGGPFFGGLYSWFGERAPLMIAGTLGAIVTFASVVYGNIHINTLIMVLLFFFGFFTSNMLLIFGLNASRHPQWSTGMVIGFTNMVVVLGAAVFQPLLGYLFDLLITPNANQVLAIAPHHYQMVFFILVAAQLTALLLIPIINREQTTSKQPRCVVLTGGIGSGKSTACKLFQKQGVPVFSADAIAKELSNEPSVLNEIVASFGERILTADGKLDRRRAREVIFSDDAAKQRLEKILHPKIRHEISKRIAACDAPYAIVEIPLYVETGADFPNVDAVIVVDCDPKSQVLRTAARDDTTAQAIENIVASQADRQQRLAFADFIIDNSEGMEHLQQQVHSVHRELMQKSPSKFSRRSFA